MKKLLIIPILFLSGLLYSATIPARSGDGISFTVVNSSLTFNVDSTVVRTSTPLAGDVTGTLGATVVGNDSHVHSDATLTSTTTVTHTSNIETNRIAISTNGVQNVTNAGNIESARVAISTVGAQGVTNATDIVSIKLSTGTLVNNIETLRVAISTNGVQNESNRVAISTQGAAIGNLQLSTQTLVLQLNTTAQAITLWQNTYKVSPSTQIINGTLPDGVKITTGNIVASGSATSSTYLRGDGSWNTPAGGTGDNLGNHVATTTLQMGSYAIQSSSSVTASEFISTASGAGSSKYYDADASNFVTIKASATIPTNLTFYFPTSLGSNGQFLAVDGAGGFFPATPAGSGDMTRAVDGVNIAASTTTLAIYISTNGVQNATNATNIETNRVHISTNGTQNATNATNIESRRVSISTQGVAIGNLQLSTQTLVLQLSTTASYLNTVALQLNTTAQQLTTTRLQLGTTATYLNTVALQLGTTASYVNTVALQLNTTAQAVTLWQNTYKVSPSTGILAGGLPSTVYVSSVNTGSNFLNDVKVSTAINVTNLYMDKCYVVKGGTTTIATLPVMIMPSLPYAVTISTLSIRDTDTGTTSIVGMVEQRADNSDAAGTDVWSGDITFENVFTGGTFADNTVPANTSLWFVPTSMLGDIYTIVFKIRATCP